MKKFNALEGIRVFAFLNVFWLHVSIFRVTKYYQSAAWAVSFFFILGGFLYGYKLSDKKLKLFDTVSFTCKKIRKFWPLHFFTTILMLGYSGIFVKTVKELWEEGFIKKLFYNLSLLMSWSQNSDIFYSFTGVAWYLSDLMFLTLLTIPIMILVNKYINNIGRLFVVLFIIILCAYLYFKIVVGFSSNLTYWLYIFPPCRLFEYISGILVGRLLYLIAPP